MTKFRFSFPHVRRRGRLAAAAVALALTGATAAATTAVQAATPTSSPAASVTSQGPCDIYAAGGTPCVAAHSTTRALYASYDGPLYQVMRLSDNAKKDIGVVNRGGYADATAQDKFCADTTCLITRIFDQSPMHNDLTQAPRGNFSGPALGGANNLPIADMAPVTINGHKAYGVFIEPGMGLRDDNTRGIATGDEPEGMYWIVDGTHFNGGCCYDYGNAEIDSRDDGSGTMETSYFGDATPWYHGNPPGPWVMTDQENNLVGCVNPGSTSKLCASLPSITSRFVTAVAKGQPHQWASLAGNAQQGALTTMFNGPRVDSTYDPMQKQGAIVLGNGGDNSNGAQGTFYEGVMTSGYPSDATDQLVQANIVAAKYDVQRLSLAPSSAGAHAPGVQTFAPGMGQGVTETFTNTTGSTVVDANLGLSLPNGWTATAQGPTAFDSIAPDQSVSATFNVTSGSKAFNGDLGGTAEWRSQEGAPAHVDTTTETVRNDSPVKINEFRIGTATDATNSFIELVNTAAYAVDVSNWTLTEHQAGQAVYSTVTIPPGTTIAAGGHYLLGLATSGLAGPAQPGDTELAVRSTTGLSVGDTVTIGTGRTAQTAKIASIPSVGATGPRVPGKIGTALKLNGANEYVALPTGIVSGLSDFTVSAWVNPSVEPTWSRIFDFGTGESNYMFLTVDGGGAGLRFAITTNGNGGEQQLTGGGLLPLNTWSHVAVTLSGTTGTLYLNGSPVATNPNMTLHPSSLGNTNQNYIGKSQWPDPLLNATVDDFNIYNRALSPAEVATLASGQAGAGNVADYKFDETGGPTAIDSSGNGKNATIIGTGTAATPSTPLWQPLPDGPITIPAGSTNVPVTSTAGFTVGQKIAIGYGDKFEEGTVTAVGTSGAQARLAAPATAGSTNLKVSSVANISVGDKIRLDIGSNTESVTVATVGTGGPNGTGLGLAAPLTQNHASNLPFSDRGTGISFTPATRFAHSSNDPVQALGAGIILDQPLTHKQPINAPVFDSSVTTAGYQGSPAPDQWFGGPALSTSAGSMVLRDDHGLVTDSLNYGLQVDPWAGEGYQGGTGSGCVTAAPPLTTGAGKSAARFPDGTDTDSNCNDFIVANATPGANNKFALDPGPLVSLETTAAGTANFVKHDDTDDLVVTAPITASSSSTDKGDATWVEAAGLNNPSCVSFESVNKPGSYLRHMNFQFHLQANDGSTLFSQDATFCPQTGNSGQGMSFQSVNFTTKYIRTFNNFVYLASDGGTNPWDDPTTWATDSSWIVAQPWAPTP